MNVTNKANEIIGTIIEIFDEYTPPNSSTKYRQFWIQTDEQNYQHIKLQVSGNRCKILDELTVNDLVEIEIMISGRIKEKKGEKRLFNNITATKITLLA